MDLLIGLAFWTAGIVTGLWLLPYVNWPPAKEEEKDDERA